MTRSVANKLYRTFVKGLISEASPLTYPENASIAEDNCIIYRRGNRSRRLGLDLEPSYRLSSYSAPISTFIDYASIEYRWEAVANQIDINFLVHQVGLTLYFYDMSISPLSSGLKSFSIDLTNLQSPYATDPKNCQVSMSSGKGYLFVVGEQFEPFTVSYDTLTDTIKYTRIYVQVRDFWGQDDGLANDYEPTTLSAFHNYNLVNQGWVSPTNTSSTTPSGQITKFIFNPFTIGLGSTTTTNGTDPIATYYAAEARYPSNSQVWWVAKDGTTGTFTPSLLTKFYFGSAHAARGHMILDAFNRDRSAVSGVAGIPVETNKLRPNSSAFFSGRIWYGCGSDIYYSQLLTDIGKAGFCYQDADPTAENISDLIATDGGMVTIPEMGKVIKMVPLGFGLAIFANNGVWCITGTQSGFSAVDLSVTKVTPIGIYSPNSAVEVVGSGRAGFGTKIFWWSPTGIQSMNERMGTFGLIQGAFDQENVTLDTIQSLYNDIPETCKGTVRGSYDKATNCIQWLYNDGSLDNPNLYNRMLNYDLTLTAFFPWTFSSNGPLVCGIFTTPLLTTVPEQPGIWHQTFHRLHCVVPNGSSYNFSFCYVYNSSFGDFTSFDGVGVPYMSFVETGYELMDDAMRKKQANYVFTYFRRTENNYVGSGPDYTVDRPSSCLMQIKWDWTNSNVANKWSTKMEAYRITRNPHPDPGGDLVFDNGYPVVYTKNKLRGSGKSIQFRFENDKLNSNFDLYGWAVSFSGNQTP